MKLFSKSTLGFYVREVHGANIPADAVEISDAAYEQVMEAHHKGGLDLAADANGYPVTVPHAPTPEMVARKLQSDAKAALRRSDTVVLECYEQGAPVPPQWVDYRAQLRAVLNGASASLPTPPSSK